MKTLVSRSFLITVLLFSCTVIFFSCKKENSQQSTPVSEAETLTISEENAEADASFGDITEVSMTTANEEADFNADVTAGITANTSLPSFAELRQKIGDCAKITIQPDANFYPKTVIIDFGDGCLGRDGKFRKGAIVLHFSAPIRREGSILTVTLRNFYLGRAHIEGTKVITNLSGNGVIKFSVEVSGGKVTFPNGRGFTYDGIRTVTQVAGIDTRWVRDDAYELVGRATIAYNNGLNITLNTEEPLLKKIGCPWLLKGTIKININGRVLYLDYGNGDCDNKATIIWSGGEKEIRLQ